MKKNSFNFIKMEFLKLEQIILIRPNIIFNLYLNMKHKENYNVFLKKFNWSNFFKITNLLYQNIHNIKIQSHSFMKI